jgi:hypothetical protein
MAGNKKNIVHIEHMTSVNSLDIITTMETDANSVPPTSATIAVNQTEKCELLICSVKN